MSKNYFSDITDLFLKIKQEENIQIDENAKAQIKQMLQAKISEMKHENTPAQDTPKQPFWSTWRYQLVGVPASLFAVVLVVFAMTNLNVSIPKEDFSPTREGQTQTVETPLVNDRPLVKTAPGPPVIDFSEEQRSLNQIPTTKESSKPTPEPLSQPAKPVEKSTFEMPKIECNGSSVLVLSEPLSATPTEEETAEKVDNNTPIINKPVKTPKEVVEKTVEKTENPEAQEIIPDSLDTDIPAETTKPEVVEKEPTRTPLETISPEVISTISKEKLQYPIYVYQNDDLKSQPAFTEEKLLKLTSSKTPDIVTLYYVADNQVVVEVEEGDIIKWYLFDNINGTWTISRYEKFVTESVVK